MTKPLTYADAGVNIEKANKLVGTIKEIAQRTNRGGVIGEIGGFGAFALNTSNFENPVLVSSTDGVGTKLKIAFSMNRHDTIGIDLVAMCVNDIAVQGAKPLFFLDYLSMGKLNTKLASEIIKGIRKVANRQGVPLLAAKQPKCQDFTKENEYDLAGFTVGIADNSKILDGSEIRVGDKLIGIASSGLHSNGYSLVRKICFDILKLDHSTHISELGKTIGEKLLTPTKIYSETIHSIIKDLPVHGIAHITGGGIEDNLLRIIPRACEIVIRKGSWDIPPIFPFLQESGNVSDAEMMRTFNNGIGLIAVVPEQAATEILERLLAMNEKAFLIGNISECKSASNKICWI